MGTTPRRRRMLCPTCGQTAYGVLRFGGATVKKPTPATLRLESHFTPRGRLACDVAEEPLPVESWPEWAISALAKHRAKG